MRTDSKPDAADPHQADINSETVRALDDAARVANFASCATAGVVAADCETLDCHAEHSLDGDEINMTITIKGTKS